MKNLTVFLSLIFIAALLSCEKEITVDLPRPELKIVIEGAIEEGEYPWVFVSRNSAYFDVFEFDISDQAILQKHLVLDATVIVSDGIITDTLELLLNPFVFPFFQYKGNTIKGEVNKSYSLTVIADGNVYTANTTIPQAVPIDSMKFKPETNQDTIGYVWIYLKDPDTVGNYYRVFTQIIGRDNTFTRPYPSVTDDKFFNGQKAEYSLYRGRDPLNDEFDDDNLDKDGVPRWFFRVGDEVIVKLTTIDAEHYRFWYSVEQQYISDGNPFASPISVKSNISNGALGVWGGYGVFKDTILIALP